MTRNIKYIVIHCTAGSKYQKAQEIAKFFTTPTSEGGRGWKVGGYHYIIEGDGTKRAMIPEDEVSNGVAGMNSVCINIAYCGGVKQDANGKNINVNIPQDTRENEQKNTLLQLVNELKAKYPKAVVVGHHYFASKACPSFDAGKEYGGIGKGNKYKGPLAGNGGSTAIQAAQSQIEQFKLAYEAVGKSLTEYPDTVLDQINSVYDTYKEIVKNVAIAQQKIPIDIPDPMEQINELMTKFQNATREFVENGEKLPEMLIPVPDGTEIQGKSLNNLLKEMGILSILSDLISPATDFIKDAPAIVDATLMGVTKSVSGATQGTVTASGLIKSALNPETDDPNIEKETNNKSILETLDSKMESAGNFLQSGTSLVAGGIGVGLGTVAGVANVANEAVSGTAALALGAGASVAGVLTKIPGVIPKIIQYAIAYSASKTIDKAQTTIGNAASSATDSLNTLVNGKEDYDASETDFIEESSPEFINETKLTSTSDEISNIYKDDFITAVGEVEQKSIDAYNATINKNREAISENQEQNSEEQVQSFNAEDILSSIEKSQKEAEAAINSEISSKATSDNPHVDSEETEKLIESIAGNNNKILGLENEFKQTFSEEAQIKLYSEVRKSLLEILPEIKIDEKNKEQQDQTNQNFVNMATFATLKLTPAIIEYLDKKFEILEEKININIDKKFEEFKSLNSPSTNI